MELGVKMNADNNISSIRKTIVARLAQVPDDSILDVLAVVDDVTDQRKRAVQNCEELTPPEAITTWEQWFREVDQLSPSDPSQVNLTKAERREVIAEDVAKKYGLSMDSVD
jgi:hypothetical protein